MKKWISVILTFMIIGVLAGCGSGSSEQTESTAAAENETTAAEPAETADLSSGEYDVDLTKLSSVMVYSEVNNMVSKPEEYIGKTVKMEGQFASYYDEISKVYYFACIIQDATACCSQGIEFELAGDHSYPDDYPKEGDEICVTGVFDTYEDAEGYEYYTLRDAKLL